MKRLAHYKIHLTILGISLIPLIGLAILVWSTPTPVVAPSPVPVSLGTSSAATSTVIKAGRFQYLEVTQGCAHDYVGTCVNVRSGPGTEFAVAERLRTGVVLKIDSTVIVDGKSWYLIEQDKSIRYPERITSDWYVYADAVDVFTDDGEENLTKNSAPTTKNIFVNLTEEVLYAYDGDVLFMKEPISTGLELTPTPAGTFKVYRKTPSRYMQGPLPGVSSQMYDLPGVPWDLYFTNEGAVIHGAYWHDNFGQKWSHGCVNLSPQTAKKLYEWADIGTPVTVQY